MPRCTGNFPLTCFEVVTIRQHLACKASKFELCDGTSVPTAVLCALCSAVQDMEGEMQAQQPGQQGDGPIDVAAEPVNGR
jgi:hypothetical protein